MSSLPSNVSLYAQENSIAEEEEGEGIGEEVGEGVEEEEGERIGEEVEESAGEEVGEDEGKGEEQETEEDGEEGEMEYIHAEVSVLSFGHLKRFCVYNILLQY